MYVVQMGFFVTLFLDFFRKFFRRNSLTFNTLVFHSRFCFCLLFPLNILSKLVYSLLSSVLGRATHKYWFIFLCVEKVFLRFMVVFPMQPGPCVFLVSTCVFPTTKVTWRMSFGFLRSSFCRSVPKFEYRASYLCLPRRFALVCIHWEFELLGFASWYFPFHGRLYNFPILGNILLISQCTRVPSWLHVGIKYSTVPYVSELLPRHKTYLMIWETKTVR